MGLLLCLFAAATSAQDLCPSTDPATWPKRSIPYVLIIADTTQSMTTTVGAADSCGYGNTRQSHQRCALDRTFKAFAGLVDFSLMTFTTRQTACSGACYAGCTYSDYPGNVGLAGCGPEPTALANSADRRGGIIQVPFRGDTTAVPAADNIANLGAFVDNVCTDNRELFAAQNSPLNGALRDAYRYFSNQWTSPDGALTYTSPLGTVGAGDRVCRPLRVILLTDGADVCDSDADAADAAAALNAGFSFGGAQRSVRVHAIGIPAAGTTVNNIAAAGGTTAGTSAADETAMVAALGNILHPLSNSEVADNADNNCNGCVDEGYGKYMNVGQACCAWANPAQRTTCLTNYRASISVANPRGTLSALPCTTAAEAQNPTTWLPYDPGEICDNADNNGVGGVDEGMRKCGTPAVCPQAETCDGSDNDCDGQIDEGGVCGACTYRPEVCDGCDNDCDSIADNGVPGPAACGFAQPATCSGSLSCRPPQTVGQPGACVANGGFGVCTNNPSPETCDATDNNCDGIVDNNLPAIPCTAPGAPSGLVFGGSSQCREGQQFCGGSCMGFIGPTVEVTDGIDNNCDGVIDNGIDVMFRNGFE